MSELWPNWPDASGRLVAVLLLWSLQAAAVVGIAWLAVSLIPRRRPCVRAAVWRCALVLVLVAPLVALVNPLPRMALRVGGPGTGPAPIAAAASDVPSPAPLPAGDSADSGAGAPAPDAAPLAVGLGFAAVLRMCLATAWLLGLAAMLVRLALGVAWARKLRVMSPLVEDASLLRMVGEARRQFGVHRPVDVRETTRLPVPVTLGMVWHVIIVPASLVEPARHEMLRHAVYHELAHVKRFDALATLYCRLLEAVLFFHPLVWVATRLYQVEQENVCDDWALMRSPDRHQYAEALVDLAERAAHGAQVAVPGLAHSPSAVRRRVARIMEGRDMSDPRMGWTGAATVIFVGLLLVLAPASLALDAAKPEPAAAAPVAAATPTPATVVLSHDNGTMDGKKSLNAGGHFVRFMLDKPGKWYLKEVRIFGSRYGSAAPPDDAFTITICDQDLKTRMYVKKPYATFERGPERWYGILVPEVELGDVSEERYVTPVPVWINVAFNPSQTKGVYVGYDTSNKESFSKEGLPDGKPSDIPEKYNWMIRLVVTQTPPEQSQKSLGEWRTPAKPVVPWQGAGLVEVKNDDGASNGKLSINGAGPAVLFKNPNPGGQLARLRIFASRYGSGYDPESTYANYYVYDDAGKVLQTGLIPYSLFTYEERWVDVPVDPVKVPESFWVLINPSATQFKGIYTHYDTDAAGTHSRAGRSPQDTRPLQKPWEWMIRAYVSPAAAPAAGGPPKP